MCEADGKLNMQIAAKFRHAAQIAARAGIEESNNDGFGC